jgi:hypothetical protein
VQTVALFMKPPVASIVCGGGDRWESAAVEAAADGQWDALRIEVINGLPFGEGFS